MLKSIVVAVDGSAPSAAAREYGVMLARLYDARLMGLHVLDVRVVEGPPMLSSAYLAETAPASTLPVQFLAALREHGEQALEEFRQAVEAAGVPVELRLEEGVPGPTIAEVADPHDLLLLGKRGVHARFGTDPLGSTAVDVARRCSTPLLLTERDAQPLTSLVVLYDGSHPANDGLKLGVDLALRAGAQMSVFTAAGSLEDAGEVQLEARDYLSAFDLAVDYRVYAGEIVIGALELLEEQPADLVVVGRQGHSRLRNLILGSTTEELLQRVSGPILVAP